MREQTLDAPISIDIEPIIAIFIFLIGFLFASVLALAQISTHLPEAAMSISLVVFFMSMPLSRQYEYTRTFSKIHAMSHMAGRVFSFLGVVGVSAASIVGILIGGNYDFLPKFFGNLPIPAWMIGWSFAISSPFVAWGLYGSIKEAVKDMNDLR